MIKNKTKTVKHVNLQIKGHVHTLKKCYHKILGMFPQILKCYKMYPQILYPQQPNVHTKNTIILNIKCPQIKMCPQQM